TSPYDYLTTVVLPQCSQDVNENQPLAICGCNDKGLACSTWAKDCANEKCAGVRLYRQLSTSPTEKPSFVRMAGQATWQRSTLTANNGAYYVDTTYSKTDQTGEGFANINAFEEKKEYYVFFVYAQGKTKQKYQIYVGSPKASVINTCTQPAGALPP